MRLRRAKRQMRLRRAKGKCGCAEQKAKFDTKTVVFASKAERGEAVFGRGGELKYKNDKPC
jgi:hypothetical protein